MTQHGPPNTNPGDNAGASFEHKVEELFVPGTGDNNEGGDSPAEPASEGTDDNA